MRAPNEKLIETLFTYNALRHLEQYGGTVYTPSTREEYTSGYDARLMGASSFDELYLQFKTPALLEGDEFSFGTYDHQHDRLQAYPPDTAYYVTHLFRSVDEIQQAQRGAAGPLDFLEFYVAIEIRRLGKVQRFRYAGDLVARQAHTVLYKLRTDTPRQHPRRTLHPGGWMTGRELLERFAGNEIGAHVILAAGTAETIGLPQRMRRDADWDRVREMSPEVAEQMIQGDEKTDWGTALRKNVAELPPDDDI